MPTPTTGLLPGNVASKLLIFKEYDSLEEIKPALTPAQMDAIAEDRQNDKYAIALTAITNMAWLEATALGYTEQQADNGEYLGFLHNPIALCRAAKGAPAGKILATEFNFRYQDPGCMWHIFETRRVNENAVLAFIGDDRGYDPDWMYFIAVVWCPEEIEKETGYLPGLY